MNGWIILLPALVTSAAVAETKAETSTDYCRDYVPAAGAGCLYPTEPARIGTVLVCRCPHSRECSEGRP